MVGRRLHITGGVGTHADQERFGADYDLPNSAYLETCGAVGAGFFHRNMNLLLGDARYVDELERALYNNVLNGVSLEGNSYYYENPLTHTGRPRWEWHGCPCCPPMFLKIVAALPGYIYARDSEGIYVNLFVGSKAKLNWGGTQVALTQTTAYPWQGQVSIAVDPESPATFTAFVRVPGWAQGQENPLGLYRSDLPPEKGRSGLYSSTKSLSSMVDIKVNGKSANDLKLVRGYAAIHRLWRKGDTISLDLPMSVRRVYAHPSVQADLGRVVLASGPLVYCLEGIDNPRQTSYYSVLMDGCLENGRDLSQGLKYNNFGIHGAASSNAADALAAVRQTVFERKTVRDGDLLQALDSDFQGFESLQKQLRENPPKVGNNEDSVDGLLVWLFEQFARACESYGDNGRGGLLRPGTGSAMYYVWLSKGHPGMSEPVVGATAEGRRRSEYFSANLAPSPGVKVRGPISVLQTYGKLDYSRVCNGGPITLELADSVFRDDDAIHRVALLIRAFAQIGCQQLQLNTLNVETLQDAKRHPERHRNLIVRVWGWSGYFCELAPEYQDHIVERHMYALGEPGICPSGKEKPRHESNICSDSADLLHPVPRHIV